MALLPPGLKTLELICANFNIPINNLPSNLESLKISSIIFNQPLDNLPAGLKELTLQNMHYQGSCIMPYSLPLNNLPHGLVYLKLQLGIHYDFRGNELYVYKHSLENLPSSIKILELDNYWGDLNTISDSVEKLDLWFPPMKSNGELQTHIQHWNKLPRSLKILNINKEFARANKIHDVTDIIKNNCNCKGICINGVEI